MKTQLKAKKASTNSRVGSQKTDYAKSYPNSNSASTFQPDYTSMWDEIRKIAHPVSFLSLKAFYSI